MNCRKELYCKNRKQFIVLKLLFFSLTILILFSSNLSSQYYTQHQIDSIDSARVAFEGDLYMDTLNDAINIGLSHGKLSRLGNGIDTAFLDVDSLKLYGDIDTFNINLDTLKYKYAANNNYLDTALDFNRNLSYFKHTLTKNTTFSFKNAQLGHRIYLECDGAFSAAFTSEFFIVQGTYKAIATNHIEIICIDTASGSERFLVYFHEDFGGIDDAPRISEEFDEILRAKFLAEDGDAAKTIKVCPVGTNISSSVVSYADGNVIYIRRNGQTNYDTLTRLDKHETFTFNASQGDRIYSIYGDAVVSNDFGTVAWPSLAISGKEFFTYVARAATTGSPAKLYIISFPVEANVSIEKDGAAYSTVVVPANSVYELDLDDIAEFYIKSDQLVALWYVGNDLTSDARPIPPISSELLWWNTASSATTTPRVSVLYPNTDIEIKYQDGTSETATVNPGTPFVAKHGGATYNQYAADGGAIIRANGIVAAGNTADGDGGNGTAWFLPDIAAQHFVLPVNAQHITFVSKYEGRIRVYDETHTLVTTLTMSRVGVDQTYPASVKYNLPGSLGIGYSFESTVKANCVFDSNEPGFAGDETVLFGGKIDGYENGIILIDETTGGFVRVYVSGGTIMVETL